MVSLVCANTQPLSSWKCPQPQTPTQLESLPWGVAQRLPLQGI